MSDKRKVPTALTFEQRQERHQQKLERRQAKPAKPVGETKSTYAVAALRLQQD